MKRKPGPAPFDPETASCHDIAARGGCGLLCPVLLRGECRCPDDVMAESAAKGRAAGRTLEGPLGDLFGIELAGGFSAGWDSNANREEVVRG